MNFYRVCGPWDYIVAFILILILFSLSGCARTHSSPQPRLNCYTHPEVCK